jgi:transcriptional regulator with XRE-family HTH domain
MRKHTCASVASILAFEAACKVKSIGPSSAFDMETSLEPGELRSRCCAEIKRKFAELVKNVKSGPGSLSGVAAQLGVSRQALSQYAEGSVPQADVLLAAFLKWDWSIRVENRGGTPAWCEFSLSDVDGGVQRRKREPIQLSLFDALTDFDNNLQTLKRSVGRVEIEIDRAFGKRA